MAEVICLSSDSNDSVALVPNGAPKAEKVVAAKSSSYSRAFDDDFDFPAVPFAYVPSANNKKESRDDLLGTVDESIRKKLGTRHADKKNMKALTSGLKTQKTSVDSYGDAEDDLCNKISNTESTSNTHYENQTRSNSSCSSRGTSGSLSDSHDKTTARKLGKLSKEEEGKLKNHDNGKKPNLKRVESGECLKDDAHNLYRKRTAKESTSSMSHDSQEESDTSSDNETKRKARNAGESTNFINNEDVILKSRRVGSGECMALIEKSNNSAASKSSGYYEDDFLDELYRKYTATESTSSPSHDSQGKICSSTYNQAKTKARKAGKLSEEDKEKLKAEKLRKQEEAARLKATKVAFAESLKSMKPGECMKFIKVSIDSNLTNCVFCPELLAALQHSEIRYVVESQLTPNSITWERDVREHYVDENHKVCTRSKMHEENQMIVIWNWDETVLRVKDRTFVERVANSLAMAPNKDVTLIVYGIEEYFRNQKNMKKRTVKNFALENDKGKERMKSSKTFEGSPIISRRELELLLTEIQVTVNAKHRLVETPQDLGLVVCQYTKAITEAPFKLERRQKLQDKMDWYVSGDNKDCVRVDKDGNGLRTLWQQQLCQFNLARMETAQAITSKYPSPLLLMEAYMNCTPAEGEKLLQDIPIRRAAGPLTASRRIGPELSKKVYVMFTSEDGEATLDNV